MVFTNQEAACRGCPVREFTGRTGCYGSPYYAAADAFYASDNHEWQELAGKEITFLESLLETATTEGANR